MKIFVILMFFFYGKICLQQMNKFFKTEKEIVYRTNPKFCLLNLFFLLKLKLKSTDLDDIRRTMKNLSAEYILNKK